MKLIVILFFGLLLQSEDLPAQTLRDLSFYINSKEVSKTSIDFYNGKFKASEDKKTSSIFDSLQTSNDRTRPFYIYLVSKIIHKADGALSEVAGLNCKEFVEKNPDYLIEFLASSNTKADKKFFDHWANIISSEFMIDCEGNVKTCIKASFQKTKPKAKKANQVKLQQFYTAIESYCH
ncbi:MAG: hypothetical protein QM737_21975 [Ferruginibacter sp.]